MYAIARRTMIAGALGLLAAGQATAQVKELKIGYQPSPIQD